VARTTKRDWRWRTVASFALLALAGFAPPTAKAEDAAPEQPLVIPSAASLIGKTLEYDYIVALVKQAKSVKSGDWFYGFDLDASGAGLTRSAFLNGADGEDLSTAYRSDQRCNRAQSTAAFHFGDEAQRFNSELAVKTGYAMAWLYAGDRGVFKVLPGQDKMSFNGDAGGFDLELPLTPLLKHSQVAFCPARVSADKVAARCTIYSLQGFVRAFDYVCDAK
jgi:hypothetical protein